jgi:hypothetical protein
VEVSDSHTNTQRRCWPLPSVYEHLAGTCRFRAGSWLVRWLRDVLTALRVKNNLHGVTPYS